MSCRLGRDKLMQAKNLSVRARQCSGRYYRCIALAVVVVDVMATNSFISTIQLFLDKILPEKREKYSPGRSEVGALSRERYLIRAMIAGGGVPHGHGAV